MKAATRALVRSRAGQRCEYCRLHERDLPLLAFHIEHILPKKHGGTAKTAHLFGKLRPPRQSGWRRGAGGRENLLDQPSVALEAG